MATLLLINRPSNRLGDFHPGPPAELKVVEVVAGDWRKDGVTDAAVGDEEVVEGKPHPGARASDAEPDVARAKTMVRCNQGI